MSDYRTAIIDYTKKQARPVDKFGHQPRLYSLALRVAEGLEYDHDVVFAAAWLHDLGVFVGHRPEDPEALATWDNVTYACGIAPTVLAWCGFPAHKIGAVVEAIRTHQPSAEPTSVEGQILRDADILEQLGAIAVMRAVCKVGRDTRYRTFSDVVPVLQRALDELPGKLRFETSRHLAGPKIEALSSFLCALNNEAGHELL
jgi:uncharacterized protein